MADIYLASSWRNTDQPQVLKALRQAGHHVYDFRNPEDSWTTQFPGDNTGGFQWSDIDPMWQNWSPWSYLQALDTQTANVGFSNDLDAMHRANVCVLLLPSGRSAHIEAGWFADRTDKTLHILLPVGSNGGWEPELMYKLADGVHLSVDSLIGAL